MLTQDGTGVELVEATVVVVVEVDVPVLDVVVEVGAVAETCLAAEKLAKEGAGGTAG